MNLENALAHQSSCPEDVLSSVTIPVAEGDGIGPEIMSATLRVLTAADHLLTFRPVTVGLKAYQSGLLAGIGQDTWEALQEHRIILKGPITTPVWMRSKLKTCMNSTASADILKPKANNAKNSADEWLNVR